MFSLRLDLSIRPILFLKFEKVICNMKKIIYLLAFIILSHTSCVDKIKTTNIFEVSEYDEIDNGSKTVPDSLTSPKAIAHFLTDSLQTNEDKLRALHIWITHNIDYDIKRAENTYTIENEIIEETLKTRSGVCRHYSLLFHYMCKEIGIKSFNISGYTLKQNNKLADDSHAWNAVQIDSSFYLIDNTWASGYSLDNVYRSAFRDKYFLVNPKEFIKTHMPFDDFFQFSNSPITYEDFEKRDFSKLHEIGAYNFHDSINKLESLDELTTLQNQNRLLKRNTTNNPLIKEKSDYNALVIDKLIFNQMLRTYNIAVQNIRAAFSLNNQFNHFKFSRVRETESVKDSMKNIVRKAARHYRHSAAQLTQLKSHKTRLSSQSKLHDLAEKRYIGQLNKDIQLLRKSLRINALYDDIVIK